jgi:transposase
VAAVLDPIGGLIGVESFEATRAGEDKLVAWVGSFGPVARVGVEGTGSYGAGVARRFRAAEIAVVEVDCANRQARRRHGKTDPLDAIEAARAAQGGRARGQAKTRDGTVEAIRALLVARRSAKAGRVRALNQIRQLGFCGSDDLRERLRGVPAERLADVAAGLRPDADSDPVTFATETAVRHLGRRVITLTAETTSTRRLLTELVAFTAPDLFALYGVGVEVAASLLVAAGDNPDRLRSEAAWAHLCGVAPLEASSGKITRHRLNRGGDRQANQALWRVALVRMRHDERTRTYVQRRITEGKTKPEIIRMLKRYIAREVYNHLPRQL